MSYPTPTRQDHQRFCEVEGWTEVRSATGRRGRHHIPYELILDDGRVLRTRISHPPNRPDIGRGLFAHVLRDQLHASEEAFWACVADGVVPDRGGRPSPTREPLPAELVHLLTVKARFSDAEVRAMTKGEAITAAQRYWSGDA
jgi:hypothetical protein